MKSAAILVLALLCPMSLAAHTAAQGVKVFGGNPAVGHFGGKASSTRAASDNVFRGGFTTPQAHVWSGSPNLHSQGLHHSWRVRRSWNSRFTGPGGRCHESPLCAAPPFLGHHGFAYHSFGVPWFTYRSFQFSGQGIAFDSRVDPAGPPPLGAPGPTPFAPASPPPVVISAPFFCFPHGLGFTAQEVFVDHLARFHRLPSNNALSYCRFVGGSRWIYFGF